MHISFTTPRVSYEVEPGDDYLPWLRLKGDNQRICTSLSIRRSSWGRGLFATSFIQKGDFILKIPLRAHLSTNELPLKIKNVLDDIDISVFFKLAVAVLYEMRGGTDSNWSPFIRKFPRLEEMSSPIFWSDEDLQMIAPSFVHHHTNKLKIMIEENFRRVKAGLASAHLDFTFDEFKYACGIVTSRAVTAAGALVLIPYLDLVNHECSSKSSVWSNTEYAAITADRDYAIGEEVTISYGNKSNSVLLLNYGFVVCANPYDYVVIRMSIDENDKLYNLKCAILDQQRTAVEDEENEWSPTGWNHFKISMVKAGCKYGDGIPTALRAFARIAVINSEKELTVLREVDEFDGIVCRHPLKNKEKEVEAHQLLREQICQMFDKRVSHLTMKLPPACELSEATALKKQLAVGLLEGELAVLKSAREWLTQYCCMILN